LATAVIAVQWHLEISNQPHDKKSSIKDIKQQQVLKAGSKLFKNVGASEHALSWQLYL